MNYLSQLHTSKILLAVVAIKTVSQDTEVRIMKEAHEVNVVRIKMKTLIYVVRLVCKS